MLIFPLKHKSLQTKLCFVFELNETSNSLSLPVSLMTWSQIFVQIVHHVLEEEQRIFEKTFKPTACVTGTQIWLTLKCKTSCQSDQMKRRNSVEQTIDRHPVCHLLTSNFDLISFFWSVFYWGLKFEYRPLDRQDGRKRFILLFCLLFFSFSFADTSSAYSTREIEVV